MTEIGDLEKDHRRQTDISGISVSECWVKTLEKSENMLEKSFSPEITVLWKCWHFSLCFTESMWTSDHHIHMQYFPKQLLQCLKRTVVYAFEHCSIIFSLHWNPNLIQCSVRLCGRLIYRQMVMCSKNSGYSVSEGKLTTFSAAFVKLPTLLNK